jgi:hypothetical protein
MKKIILIAALSSLTLIPRVHAQAAPATPAAPAGVLSDLSVNGTMDFEDQYIFRGKKITNAAFQPSVNFNYGNIAGGTITAYAWTSQPITSRPPGTEENNEIDLGVKYDNNIPSYAALGYEPSAMKSASRCIGIKTSKMGRLLPTVRMSSMWG